jgi:hypothetical protein
MRCWVLKRRYVLILIIDSWFQSIERSEKNQADIMDPELTIRAMFIERRKTPVSRDLKDRL